jgi:YVTN family beta-propeller protein
MSVDPRVGSELGGYSIESVLGRGGMGVVYLARDAHLGRRVAVKVLSAELAENEAFRQRFTQESQVAASLDHPNVLPVFEAGEAEGVLFLAMRYVPGTDLASLIEREGPLDPLRATSILTQVAGALDAAHAQGLVHRDVKGSNVLVAPLSGSAGEQAYLTDFGLTRATDPEARLTTTGQFLGTADYAAPEQIEGRPVDARTDVYALGCLAYECLTGRPPFPRESEVAVVYAHLRDQPPPVTETRPELAPAVDPAVARAMAKRPDDRFDSAGQFAAVLGQALRPEAPAAEERPLRPRGWLIGAAAGLLMAVALGVFLVTQPDSPSPTGSPVPSATATLRALTPAQAAQQGTRGVYAIDLAGDSVSGNIAVSGRRLSGVQRVPNQWLSAHVVADGDFVWAIDRNGLQKFRQDTGALLETFPGANGQAAAGFGSMWATSATGEVHRIDPTTNRTVARIRTDEKLEAQFAPLAAGEGGVWVGAISAAGSGRYFVLRVDPGSDRVIDVIELPDFPDDVAVGQGAVWVRANAFVPKVFRIDPDTLAVTTIELGDQGGADGIAVGLGYVFVSDGTNDTLLMIDPRTDDLFATVPVGDGPGEVAVGPESVWVANLVGDTVSRVDPRTREVEAAFEIHSPIDLDVGEQLVWVRSCGRELSPGSPC